MIVYGTQVDLCVSVVKVWKELCSLLMLYVSVLMTTLMLFYVARQNSNRDWKDHVPDRSLQVKMSLRKRWHQS